MNAQLQFVPRAIERPTYDNKNVANVILWVRDNERALLDYYAALGRALPKDEDNTLTGFSKAQTFCAWCQCQHDRETGRF